MDIEEGTFSIDTSREWQKIPTEDGNCYYWNRITNETTWETPKELQSNNNLQLDDDSNVALTPTLINSSPNIILNNDNNDTEIFEDEYQVSPGGELVEFLTLASEGKKTNIKRKKTSPISEYDGDDYEDEIKEEKSERAESEDSDESQLETIPFTDPKIPNNELEIINFEEELLWAAKAGDNTQLIQMLKHIDVDNILQSDENKNHDTALCKACQFGNVGAVSLLINRGADVNYKNKNDETPLMMATRSGFKNICKILINNGANINDFNKYGYTPLHISLYISNFSLIKYLIENGAEINIKDIFNTSPLMKAVQSNNINIIKYLIEKGANIEDLYHSHKFPPDNNKDDNYPLSPNKLKNQLNSTYEILLSSYKYDVAELIEKYKYSMPLEQSKNIQDDDNDVINTLNEISNQFSIKDNNV